MPKHQTLTISFLSVVDVQNITLCMHTRREVRDCARHLRNQNGNSARDRNRLVPGPRRNTLHISKLEVDDAEDPTAQASKTLTEEKKIYSQKIEAIFYHVTKFSQNL